MRICCQTTGHNKHEVRFYEWRELNYYYFPSLQLSQKKETPMLTVYLFLLFFATFLSQLLQCKKQALQLDFLSIFHYNKDRKNQLLRMHRAGRFQKRKEK